MPLHLTWEDIALRLFLTFVGGAVLGLNRGEHGRPAGLRTTLLITLAASLAMIEANLLLPTAGKPDASFANFDPMRLPLGILSGIGFIGGGAIMKRGDLVLGVTTAATLWFATVMGLCFGAGYLTLGLVAMGLGFTVLWALKFLEDRLRKEHRGTLKLVTDPSGPTEERLREIIERNGWHVVTWAVSYDKDLGRNEFDGELRWRSRGENLPFFLPGLRETEGIHKVKWWPQGMPTERGELP